MRQKGFSKSPTGRSRSAELAPVHPAAAGIDVHSEFHFVAVPDDRDPEPVRKFGAFTGELHALADWLAACGITSVARESTGVYWIPLYELLQQRGFEVILVDPRKLKSVPGRKSDVIDCPWLRQLHTYGLLAAAFRPDEQTTVLRADMRQRATLVEFSAQHILHMQKALTQRNLQLEKVLSDRPEGAQRDRPGHDALAHREALHQLARAVLPIHQDSAPTTANRRAGTAAAKPAPAPTVWPPPCAWRPSRCTIRKRRWGPTCAG